METAKKITVLVVDDSPLCRQLIIDALARDPELEVVGTAANGEEAVRRAAELKPQVITMDVDMPVLDGLSATEQIMASTPTPILVLTGDPRSQSEALTHRALGVGALALQVKPPLDAGAEAWNLAREVRLLSTVRVIRHLRGTRKPGLAPAPSPGSSEAPGPSVAAAPLAVIGVGSSTGGPPVVHRLLAELPADFPVPLLIVQHINDAFAEPLAGWLAQSSRLKVKVARDGELLLPGTALLAPAGSHLTVQQRGRVSVVAGPARDGHLPSATALLESLARVYGKRAAGVLLTGMGTDGVEGLAAIHAAGGRTFAQSQESCVVFGMPGAAIARGVVDQVVHADELAPALMRLVRGSPSTGPG